MYVNIFINQNIFHAECAIAQAGRHIKRKTILLSEVRTMLAPFSLKQEVVTSLQPLKVGESVNYQPVYLMRNSRQPGAGKILGEQPNSRPWRKLFLAVYSIIVLRS